MADYSTELDPFIVALDTALDSTNDASASFTTQGKYAKVFLEKALFEIAHAMVDHADFTRDEVRGALNQNGQRIMEEATKRLNDDVIVV